MKFSLLKLVLSLILTLNPAIAGTVTADFTSSSTIPVTASGYTATGNDVSLSLGFAPPPGTSLIVVKNTAPGFISGQFSNLTHGQSVNLTYLGLTYPFVANYYGGTGNDLVLHWAYQDAYTWGQNTFGQLGNNGSTNSSVPVLVTKSGVLAGKTVISVAGGESHSLALCSDGTVVAWGENSFGQLGNNGTTNSSLPVIVTSTGVLAGRTVISVAAGDTHSVALCSDGRVVAWGENTVGQLGNNGTTNSKVPVLVSNTGVLAGKIVVSVVAGRSDNLALCSDGTLVTWGSSTGTGVPVAMTSTGVLAGKTVVAVAGGGPHSLALCSDGTVAAWGDNSYGQLGNNTTGYEYEPVAVTHTGVLAARRWFRWRLAIPTALRFARTAQWLLGAGIISANSATTALPTAACLYW
jgi:hypothetical protein